MQKSIPGNFVDMFGLVGSDGNPVGANIAAASAKIISANTIAPTALLTAVAGQTHKVQGLRLSVAGAVIVTLLDGATVLEKFNYAGVGGGIVLDLRDKPYWTGSVNTALNIVLSAAVQVDGHLDYITS